MDVPADKRHHVLRPYLSMAVKYWTGDGRWRAWGLTILVLSLVGVQLALLVGFNLWNRYFFDALEAKNVANLWSVIYWLPVLVVTNAFFISALVAFRMRLQMRWREWLTTKLTGWWIADQRYYRLSLVAPEHAAPEYRIADDVRLAIEPLVEFAIGLISAFVTAATFATILWNVAGSLNVTLFGKQWEIPAYMALAAVIYAVVASTAAYIAGRPLVRKVADKNQEEAQFRAMMTRLRENSESIALIRGDSDERHTIGAQYKAVVTRWLAIIRQQSVIGLVLNTNSALFAIVPLLLVTPKYLSGSLTLGAVMQVVAAFSAVQGALIWFVDNFVRLAEWYASAFRVIELTTVLEELDVGLDTSMGPNEIEFGVSKNGVIHFDELSVADRGGGTMISDTSVTISQGEKVLVTGESGSGKSTLSRALAGLWPWGSGKINIPKNQRIAFLPQKPYLPDGPLRAVLLYPHGKATTTDQVISAAMERCGIKYLIKRLDEENQWDRILSGGEKQRIAFARLVIQKPEIIVMDEATSALDEDSQYSLLSLFREELITSTVLSVGHRPGIEEFHDRKLHLTKMDAGAHVSSKSLSRWSIRHLMTRRWSRASN